MRPIPASTSMRSRSSASGINSLRSPDARNRAGHALPAAARSRRAGPRARAGARPHRPQRRSRRWRSNSSGAATTGCGEAAPDGRDERASMRMLGDFDASQPSGPCNPPRGTARAPQALREPDWPTRRDENWRYANLRATRAPRRISAGATAAPARRFAAGQRAARVTAGCVFVDGRLYPTAGMACESGIARCPAQRPLRPSRRWPVRRAARPAARAGCATCSPPDAAALRLAGDAAHRDHLHHQRPRLAGCRLSASAADTRKQAASCAGRATSGLPMAALRSLERPRSTAIDLRLRMAGRDLCTPAAAVRPSTSCSDTLAARSASAHATRAPGHGWRCQCPHQRAGAARRPRRGLRPGAASPIGRGEQVADAQLTIVHDAPETRTDELFRGIAERARTCRLQRPSAWSRPRAPRLACSNRCAA